MAHHAATADPFMPALDLDNGRYKVAVTDILDLVGDPFEDAPWGCGAITIQEVIDCSDINVGSSPQESVDRVYHIARIAYLAVNGWEANVDVPHIDVGFGGYAPLHALTDGNHRVAAAVIRGDEYMIVDISGDIDDTEEIFHITPETQFYA